MSLKNFWLFAIAFVFALGMAHAVAPVVVISDPDGDGNYLKGTQRITFTVSDGDANSNADSNLFARIYVSVSAGAHTNVVVLDLNLMAIANCGDQNFVTVNTCTYAFNSASFGDRNYFLDVNVTDWTPAGVLRDSAEDSSGASFTIDNTNPAVNFRKPAAGATVNSQTVAFDLNDSLSPINRSSATVKVNGVASSVFASATDCTKNGDTNYVCSYTETGVSANGDYNITVAVSDLATNASGDTNRSFTYDSSATTPLIDSPLSGRTFGSTDTVTFNYHTSDSDIAKYWVYADSKSPIDNGTSLSYTFTGLAAGSHTLNVKSMDNVDNNSAVASVTITIAGPTTGGGGEYCGNGVCAGNETSATCPQDCAAVCGDGACTQTESVNNCPADCGPPQVCGNGVCDAGETFQNCPSDCVAPIEGTPGTGSGTGGTPGQGERPFPPACVASQCNDSNPCTSDSCGNANSCLNIPVADGTSCGSGKVCSSGSCVEQQAREISQPQADNTPLIAGGIVVVLAALAYFFYFRKP